MSRLRRIHASPATKPDPYEPSAFIADHIIMDTRYETTNAELYEVYRAAAKRKGKPARSHRALSQAVIRAGFEQAKSRKHGRVWLYLLLVNLRA